MGKRWGSVLQDKLLPPKITASYPEQHSEDTAKSIQWRNYVRRGEAIASGRLAQGGALSPRIIFF